MNGTFSTLSLSTTDPFLTKLGRGEGINVCVTDPEFLGQMLTLIYKILYDNLSYYPTILPN
jgi:hypothetical protein